MSATPLDQRAGALVREHPVMRWGPVFAGWLVATGTAIVLYVFGLAVGFSAFEPHNVAAIARGVSTGAMVWMILIWGAALWVGAMFASWFDGRNDTEMGVIRDLTVWGLSMAVTGLLIASGLPHLDIIASTPDNGDLTVDPTRLAHYAAAFMWSAFGSSVLSLLTSAFGGWVGAHQVHRVYHLRDYALHGREVQSGDDRRWARGES